jgi:hypothetical protein
MSFNDRLKKLEATVGAGEVCPDCGLDASGWPRPKWRGPVFFDIDTTPSPTPPAMPCPTCGVTPGSFTLRIGDKPIKRYAGVSD